MNKKNLDKLISLQKILDICISTKYKLLSQIKK